MEQEKQACKCGKTNCSCKKFMFWVFIIVVLVGGFFYYNQAAAPVEDMTSIEITENEDGTKTVRNLEEGYEVILKNSEQIISSDARTLTVKGELISDENKDLGFYPQYVISSLEYEGVLEDWVKQWIGEQEFGQDYTYIQESVGSQQFIVIDVPSMGDSIKLLAYKFNNKLYLINTTSIDPIEIFKRFNFVI